MNVVISPLYIKLCKVGKLAKIVDEIRDEEQWVCIFDSMLVEILIVLDWVEFTIFLFDEEKGGGLQGFRWLNLSHLQVFIYEGFASFQFCRV